MIPLTPSPVSIGFTFSSDWRGFELKQNDEIVASLKRPRVWSSEFIAATPAQNWIIRRAGFWGNKGEIQDETSRQQVALFKSGWGGKGSIQFADGQAFHVITRGWWHPVWSVTTSAGNIVLQLHTHEKCVEFHDKDGITDDRLTLLVLFTLYRVRQAEDAAAAAVATAS